LKHWKRQGDCSTVAVDRRDLDQAIRLPNEESPQHQRIQDAEDSGIRANPERQGQDRYGTINAINASVSPCRMLRILQRNDEIHERSNNS